MLKIEDFSYTKTKIPSSQETDKNLTFVIKQKMKPKRNSVLFSFSPEWERAHKGDQGREGKVPETFWQVGSRTFPRKNYISNI